MRKGPEMTELRWHVAGSTPLERLQRFCEDPDLWKGGKLPLTWLLVDLCRLVVDLACRKAESGPEEAAC